MPISATTRFSGNILQPAQNPDLARTDAYAIKPSSTIVAGTILGQVTATKALAAYASGNSDGSQVAIAIAKFDTVTDSLGNITFGIQSGGGPHGETYLTAPVYIEGEFRCEDLTGLDSTAVTDLGRILKGNSTTGVIKLS